MLNNIEGKPIHQVMADYQSFFDIPPLDATLNNQSGLLRIIKFIPLENKVYVKTYSPYLNQTQCNEAYEGDGYYRWNGDATIEPVGCYRNHTDAEFSFSYMPFNYLGQHLNVASNTNATFLWAGRKASTTYEWFVEVSDGSSTNTSQVWNFTTTSPPP